MYKDPTEYGVTTILDLLPSTEVEVQGKKYMAYLEEDVVSTDRCFVFTTDQMPTKPFLFQITPFLAGKDMSRSSLEKIECNEMYMFFLVAIGLEILEGIEGKVTKFSELIKHINIGKDRYTIAYQSPEVVLVGESLHDQYEKRVMKRIPK